MPIESQNKSVNQTFESQRLNTRVSAFTYKINNRVKKLSYFPTPEIEVKMEMMQLK